MISKTEDLIKQTHLKTLEEQAQKRKKELMAQLRKKSEEEKGDCIVNYIQGMGEEYKECGTLGCNNCRTSFYNHFQLMVPSTRFDSMKWSLIWETPKTIKK